MSTQPVTTIHTGRRRPRFQLHHRLALSMDEAGFKPEEMATFLKCSTGTISNYRNNHTRPNFSTLVRWADKCEVDFEWLTTDEPGGPDVVSDLPEQESARCPRDLPRGAVLFFREAA